MAESKSSITHVIFDLDGLLLGKLLNVSDTCHDVWINCIVPVYRVEGLSQIIVSILHRAIISKASEYHKPHPSAIVVVVGVVTCPGIRIRTFCVLSCLQDYSHFLSCTHLFCVQHRLVLQQFGVASDAMKKGKGRQVPYTFTVKTQIYSILISK